MKFLATFHSVSTQVLNETGTVIYELLTLLPEDTYNIVHESIDDGPDVCCEVNSLHIQIELMRLDGFDVKNFGNHISEPLSAGFDHRKTAGRVS